MLKTEQSSLSLMLLYLTSWKEKDRLLGEVQKTWKGYSYEVLDKLRLEGYITGGNKSKSVM